MKPRADALDRLVAPEARVLDEPHGRLRLEAGVGELLPQPLRRREALPVEPQQRREEAVEPVPLEVLVVEGRDDETAVGPEHPRRLGERHRPVDEMGDEPHHDALEPAVAEGQRLRPPLLEPDR